LSGEALDPGEKSPPGRSFDTRQKQGTAPGSSAVVYQTIDDAFIAVSLNDFVQPIQNDSLFVHYQEHDFHIAIYHASIAGKHQVQTKNTCRTVKSLWQNR
jgi:hypothetical protein